MSYRIRWEIREATGLRSETYATREAAQKAIDERIKIPGLAYTVEEVPDAPEPGSTAAHHVEILPARVCLAVAVTVFLVVALSIPLAEARLGAWADHEEAKAAQAWRRTP